MKTLPKDTLRTRIFRSWKPKHSRRSQSTKYRSNLAELPARIKNRSSPLIREQIRPRTRGQLPEQRVNQVLRYEWLLSQRQGRRQRPNQSLSFQHPCLASVSQRRLALRRQVPSARLVQESPKRQSGHLAPACETKLVISRIHPGKAKSRSLRCWLLSLPRNLPSSMKSSQASRRSISKN